MSLESLANHYMKWLEESVTAAKERGKKTRAVLENAKTSLETMIKDVGLKAKISESEVGERQNIILTLGRTFLKRGSESEVWYAGQLWMVELRNGNIGVAYCAPGFSAADSVVNIENHCDPDEFDERYLEGLLDELFKRAMAGHFLTSNPTGSFF